MGTADLPLSFTRRQALRAGVDDGHLAGMVRSGELVRVRRGTFTRGSRRAVGRRAS